MITVKIPVPSRQFWVAAVSILLSVFMVGVVAYSASTIDTSSVGAGTSTPGVALGVKGAAIIEGFIHADYFYSTSTSNSTFGGAISVTEAATSTFSDGVTVDVSGLEIVAGGLRVNAGEVIIDEYITVDGAAATSTFTGGLNVDSNTLVVDFDNNRVGIGTSTPGSDLVIGSGTATTTLFLAGGASVGSEIILKSSDGEACISITVNRGSTDIGVSASVATLLFTEVVACPAE